MNLKGFKGIQKKWKLKKTEIFTGILKNFCSSKNLKELNVIQRNFHQCTGINDKMVFEECKKITDWKECEGLVISCHEKNTSFKDVTGI